MKNKLIRNFPTVNDFEENHNSQEFVETCSIYLRKQENGKKYININYFQSNIRVFLVIFMMSLSINFIQSQTVSSGYIIALENDIIITDLGKDNIKVGQELNVFNNEGNSIGKIKINKVYDRYSEAQSIPSFAIKKMVVGMKIGQMLESNYHPIINESLSQNNINSYSSTSSINIQPNITKDERISVIVAPAQVNDIVGVGYFGNYVADLLMEQLMLCDKVKLLDRSIFNEQVAEIEMTGTYIDPKQAIQQGKIAGARYIVQVTMQKPDVANITTGVPLASVMGALSSATGKNIGAQYGSNMQIANLTAAVALTARVVDLQSGEVVFMASGKGNAKGKSQLSMEYGALGGLQLNGGADAFKQTVTGQAIQRAFVTVGKSLNQFFNGTNTSRVMGSTSGYGNSGGMLIARGINLYEGINKLNNQDLETLFYDKQNLWFKYNSAKNNYNWGKAFKFIGIPMLVAGACGLCTPGYLMPGAVGAITGTFLTIVGISKTNGNKGKMQSIATEYNRSKLQSYTSPNSEIKLVIPNDGLIGLQLTF